MGMSKAERLELIGKTTAALDEARSAYDEAYARIVRAAFPRATGMNAALEAAARNLQAAVAANAAASQSEEGEEGWQTA
jgi:hypothetical protein